MPDPDRSRPVIEVQAVRTLLRVSVVALCLALAGCKASSSGRDGLLSRPASSAGSGQLFLGSPTGGGGSSATASNPTSSDTGSLASAGPTRREGVLAGRILDQESKLRPGAVIQVIDLEAPKDDGAPLSVLANRDGYFDISGLEAGRSYRLVARVKDGDRTITGSARVVPPNVRVAIWMKDEAPDEPAPEAKPSSGPAASLGAPIKTPPAGVTTPLPEGESSRNPVPPPVTTKDPPGSSGDASLTATVPNASSVPGRDHTPEKPANSMPPPPPATPAEAPPSDAAKADIPETKTRVPSCVRTGGRVENFALYDTKGDVYELARDRKGKLVLLDFWHTRCTPCIHAIPHLNKLHSRYSRHGLEILGVAYEKGTLEEKQQSLARASQRHNLTFQYRVLFGGGGKARCPVAEQLEVQSYPTLVLLDETGKIIFRAEGIDDRTVYELDVAIYQKLFPGRLAGR